MMVLCTLLFLSTLIHTAPIPKGDAEGIILLAQSTSESHEMILMKSNGTILKRFEPIGIDDRIDSVKLNPTATKAIVCCAISNRKVAVPAGGIKELYYSIYQIDLEKTDQPAKLICKDLVSTQKIAAWLPNDKGIIFSDLDEKQLNAKKQDHLKPYRNWTFDFESGKKELLKLPNGHWVTDLSSDGKTLLSCLPLKIQTIEDYSKFRSYLTPLDTMKPKMIVDSEFSGMQLSPDGNWVLGMRLTKQENSPSYNITHHILNLKTKEFQQLRLPETAVTLASTPVWANKGKSVAFIWDEKVPDPDMKGLKVSRYNLSLLNVTDHSQKLIFQSKPQEYFTRFDWR